MEIPNRDVAEPGKSGYDAVAAAAGAARAPLRYRALPTTPAASFDVALLVPNDLPVARVEQVMRTAAGELLESLTLLSEFRGAGVPAGMRSVAWRLTFRDPERTLREKEITGRRDKVLKSLDGELGVRQRTS
jgi:phenylalanyl-tRNA synthetase beta chain